MQNITINKDKYYKIISENFILKEIYIKNKLKNYDLLNKLIKLLAMTNKLLSAREIHKILNYNNISVSHVTTIEYLDYILKSGLVNKVYRYDFKLDNISSGKAKYLFSSSEIRKAVLNGKIEKHILNENIVYETLIKLGYKPIYTGKNGSFNFSFFSNNTLIHISESINKNEVKKEINKLKKIGGDFSKYLIVDSIKELGIRPSTYFPIFVMELNDFLIKNKIKN